MQKIIIGTAGHVDHGKSALVKALTGIDPDRLPEEKLREMTIDLGFVFFPISEQEEVAIIDVPGHERFLRTMIAGAQSIRMVLFVVAADDGVMPQTIEHLDVLKLLSVEKGIIVITKTDKIEREYLSIVSEDIKNLVEGSFLQEAPIYPVSSFTNEGIEELKLGIKSTCSQIKPLSANGIFRCPIDRIFSMKGFGTVVCGTVISGRIKSSELVEILPIQKKSRIRNLQVRSQSVLEVYAGQRAAFNLADVEISEIYRGDELSIPNYLIPTQIIEASFFLLPNVRRPLKNNERVRLHKGTAEVMARVIILEREKIEPGTEGYIQLRIERPIVGERKERYILRSYSPMKVIGGGHFLEIYAQKGGRFKKEKVEYLENVENAEEKNLVEAIIEYAKTPIVNEEELIKLTNIPVVRITEYLQDLQNEKVIKRLNDKSFTHNKTIEKLKAQCLKTVEDYIKVNPLKVLMPTGELMKVLKVSNPYLLQITIEELNIEGKIEAKDDGVRPTGLDVKLSAATQKLLEEVEDFALNKGYRSFGLVEVIDLFPKEGRGRLKNLLNYLLKNGVVVEIKEDFYLHHKMLEQARAKLINYLRETGTIRVKEYKNLLGVPRDLARDILDHFFNKGVTIRTEGTHRLVNRSGE